MVGGTSASGVGIGGSTVDTGVVSGLDWWDDDDGLSAYGGLGGGHLFSLQFPNKADRRTLAAASSSSPPPPSPVGRVGADPLPSPGSGAGGEGGGGSRVASPSSPCGHAGVGGGGVEISREAGVEAAAGTAWHDRRGMEAAAGTAWHDQRGVEVAAGTAWHDRDRQGSSASPSFVGGADGTATGSWGSSSQEASEEELDTGPSLQRHDAPAATPGVPGAGAGSRCRCRCRCALPGAGPKAEPEPGERSGMRPGAVPGMAPWAKQGPAGVVVWRGPAGRYLGS